MAHYDYHRPTSLEQVWQLAAANPDAALVAGGTDLFVQLRKRRKPEPTALISLRRVPELSRIDSSDVGPSGSGVPRRRAVGHAARRRPKVRLEERQVLRTVRPRGAELRARGDALDEVCRLPLEGPTGLDDDLLDSLALASYGHLGRRSEERRRDLHLDASLLEIDTHDFVPRLGLNC